LTKVAEKKGGAPAVVSRRAELERHFQMFADVPREVVVKEDVLRMGVRFSEAALNHDPEARPRAYYIFSYDRTGLEDMQRAEYARAPEEVRLSGGPYDLRPTLVSARVNVDSPYLIEVVEQQLVLISEDEPLARVEFPPLPAFYRRTFEDGTPYHDIVSVIGWGHRAFSTLLRRCALWGLDVECKFCDLNANYRALKAKGRAYTLKKPVDRVATVMAEIFLNRPAGEARCHSYIMTGGSVLRGSRGTYLDLRFYLDYIGAVQERLGGRWPLLMQMAACDRGTLTELKRAGVAAYHPNFEVWDPELFAAICPGKDRFVGRDEWIRRTVEAVDVFGEGNVCPGFVSGVELCQEYGFKSVARAVKSTTEGLDYLMSHGVTPRVAHWCIEPLSALAGNPSPPLEYFIRVDRAWFELWDKYHLPALRGYPEMGPGRSLNQNSAFLDVGPEP
jgi:hypothetical protein